MTGEGQQNKDSVGNLQVRVFRDKNSMKFERKQKKEKIYWKKEVLNFNPSFFDSKILDKSVKFCDFKLLSPLAPSRVAPHLAPLLPLSLCPTDCQVHTLFACPLLPFLSHQPSLFLGGLSSFPLCSRSWEQSIWLLLGKGKSCLWLGQFANPPGAWDHICDNSQGVPRSGYSWSWNFLISGPSVGPLSFHLCLPLIIQIQGFIEEESRRKKAISECEKFTMFLETSCSN